jgi:uncharacterized membrane protein YeaQ/YmgE (transglycosylase-associated protein family)
VLILGIILFGMLIGAAAQLILGRDRRGVDWGMALVAGLVGSFIGGLLFSLIAGDGLAFRPSGVIGSIIGALVVTAVWRWSRSRRRRQARQAEAAAKRSGRPNAKPRPPARRR